MEAREPPSCRVADIRGMPSAFENFTAKEWREQLKDESFDVLKTNRYGQLQRRKVRRKG